MNSTAENNKRIAKNTIFLYFRQILIMAVSLYTVRVVLAALGEEDYGIYNVVGGFVSMFSVLSGAFSVGISRFITYEMGQPDVTISRLQRIFSSSILIQMVMGLLICLLISTFGTWFVENKMVIPVDRLNVAFFVLWFSTLSFFTNLLSIPYNALILAHEQMKVFAYIGIVEVLLKLGVACLLVISPLDKLWLYSLSMVIVALIIRFIYVLYCKHHFEECCFVWVFDKLLLLKMFSFSSWAFLGIGSSVLKDHGVNVLLNIFCGPAVNAARGIATQVTNAVNLFIMNFMQAVNPQITKLYSSGDFSEMHRLIFKSSRFSFYLMLLLSLPLMKSIKYILSCWLISVPDHTALFIQLLLIFFLMDSLVYPLTTGLFAEGNIRIYQVVIAVLNLSNVLLSYWCLKCGLIPEYVYIVSIIVEIGIMCCRIYFSAKAFNLSVKNYCVEVIGKAMIVALITGTFTYFINFPIGNLLGHFVLITFCVMFFAIAIIYKLGLTQGERSLFLATIRNKILSK